jgi:uncharacterized membrane protein YfcA
VLLASLGAVGGFAAGLLGFGGGVVMFPLLLYVPSLLGVADLDAKTVAAVVVAQVFFSAAIAGAAHFRSGRVHRRLTLVAGFASAGGAFVGGIASQWASNRVLLILFGVITLLVMAMMLLPAPGQSQDSRSTKQVSLPTMPLSIFSILTGGVTGLLGSGNFIFPPLLIYILKVPTRIAIGSSPIIAMINSSAGFLGKLLTDQIPILLTFVVVCGAMLGAIVGEQAHRRLSSATLRRVYAALVTIIAVRVWLTLLA